MAQTTRLASFGPVVGGDPVTASEGPSFSRNLDIVCRVLLLVGVVGGLSISVFGGVVSVGNDFLLSLLY
jgi:hypothetical protein